MICPYCGKSTPDGSEYCAVCGYPLDARARADESSGRETRKFRPAAGEWSGYFFAFLRFAIVALFWIISLSILGYGVYKIYYWHQSTEISRKYESGELPSPTVEQVTLGDGRTGHVISFFGQDGDMIYIEELRRSYLVVGGVARVEIADSYWFEQAAEDVESAEIALTPIQTFKGGSKQLLPVLRFTVEAPVSPMTVISPAADQEPILSSMFQLELKVVPGSTVLVDGENVTDFVNAQGEVSVNVAVYPQGDNPISILVKTPHHKEARQDIVLYRQPMEINLELSINTQKTSVRDRMSVNGACDPGATVSVDTPYEEGTLKQDEKGSFSFTALFDHIGYNTVRFRAKQEGKTDSIISFEVYYLPTLNEYSRKAWGMDYTQLTRCWDIWNGRIFKCEGTVVSILSYDPQMLVLDVSSDGSGDYLIIENMSGVSITETGGKYVFYADVAGREEYIGEKYPYLIGRYAESAEE